MTKKKGTGLRWVPVWNFLPISDELIEQVEPKVDPAKIRAIEKEICRSQYNILGVFTPMSGPESGQGVVNGFLWGQIDPINDKLNVIMLSIDKEYQGRGIIREAKNILDKIVKEHNLKSIVIRTTQPELFKSIGAKDTGIVTMEV